MTEATKVNVLPSLVEDGQKNIEDVTNYEKECQRIIKELLEADEKLGGKVVIRSARYTEKGILLRGFAHQPTEQGSTKDTAFFVSSEKIYALSDAPSWLIKDTETNQSQHLPERIELSFRPFEGDIKLLQEAINESVKKATEAPPTPPNNLKTIKIG